MGGRFWQFRTTVACPKRQTSVLNGKSTVLSRFPPNLDEIWSDHVPWEDLGTHQILSSLVGKKPRKVDLPFRTAVSDRQKYWFGGQSGCSDRNPVNGPPSLNKSDLLGLTASNFGPYVAKWRPSIVLEVAISRGV